MELLSIEFLMSLLAIIMVDLILAGDNAVVIALAARNIPKEKQKKVIIWGTVGAIAIRLLATILVVWLLKIPGLLLVGGIVLIWISYKLLINEDEHENIDGKSTVLQAIGTVMVADMMMGVDNVIAVAGVADGHMLLIILGLLISVPIMIFGSTFVLVIMEKFPIVIYIGSGVLAFTAGKMLLDEPILEKFVEPMGAAKWLVIALIVVAVIVAGRLTKLRRSKLNLELGSK